MKLIVAIVQKEDAGSLIDVLTKKEYRVTRINTAGGFLKSGNATILVGVEDAMVEDVLGVIEATCISRIEVVNPIPPIMEPGEFFLPHPMEVQVGGATVFVLSVDRYERL